MNRPDQTLSNGRCKKNPGWLLALFVLGFLVLPLGLLPTRAFAIPPSTDTPTDTATNTATETATDSATLTPTDSATQTATDTATLTATLTATTTPSATPTVTATYSSNPSPVNLLSAGTYVVLAGTSITNTGATTLCGNLGLWPGSSVTGPPTPVMTCGGVMNINNSPAQTAQGDLTAAYNDAAGRTSVTHVPELGGLTLTPGVYSSATGFLISTMLTLDAQSNPNAVFIFQAGSGLTDSASVTLINGAQASNVFWQVGSSAAINGANFVGTILALTSITFGTGSEFEGRALARNGLVSLQGQGGGLDTPTPANSPTQTPTSSPTQTVTPTTTVSPTTTYSPTNTATITPTVAGLGILALAPVPVRAGGNVILFFDKAPASTAWEIYNVAGERVARLSFNGFPGPQSHYWQTAGVAPGVYFVKVQIAYRDGTNIQIIRKAVVVP